MLHAAAMVWIVAATAGLVAATNLRVLEFRPGADAYAEPQQAVFTMVFALMALLGWRWPVIGGLGALSTAGALAVFASRQLDPVHASIVVGLFLIPAATWLALGSLRAGRRSARVIVAAVVVVAGLGAVAGDRAHHRVFGPTHPTSRTPALDGPVDWVWSGGVTQTGATVVARVPDADGPVRLAYGRDADLADARYVAPVASGAGDRMRFRLAGLRPGTTYHLAVDVGGRSTREPIARLSTLPEGPGDLTIAVGACARTGSNGRVFDAIRAAQPDLYVVMGDFHYGNVDRDDRAAFRALYDLTLRQPAQSALYRTVPIAYTWDDHDFGGDNADRTAASARAAGAAYRANVPHYPLAESGVPVHQAFTMGRVRVVITDARSRRAPSSVVDGPGKTMLGVRQKAWFKRQLLAARDAGLVVMWVNPVPWIAAPADGADHWGGYATERRELADFIADRGIDALFMVSGDAHMLAIDDGSNSGYSRDRRAGFPILHAAALDRSGSAKGGPYSRGALPGGGQFGVVRIDDDGGPSVGVELTGRTWDGRVPLRHRVEFHVPAAERRGGTR